MRRLLRPLIILMIVFAFSIPGCKPKAIAQSVTPQPAPACEQQVDQLRSENIALRKQLAQAMFQAAFLEEQGISLKKQVDAANAQGKAAEKK